LLQASVDEFFMPLKD